MTSTLLPCARCRNSARTPIYTASLLTAWLVVRHSLDSLYQATPGQANRAHTDGNDVNYLRLAISNEATEHSNNNWMKTQSDGDVNGLRLPIPHEASEQANYKWPQAQSDGDVNGLWLPIPNETSSVGPLGNFQSEARLSSKQISIKVNDSKLYDACAPLQGIDISSYTPCERLEKSRVPADLLDSGQTWLGMINFDILMRTSVTKSIVTHGTSMRLFGNKDDEAMRGKLESRASVHQFAKLGIAGDRKVVLDIGGSLGDTSIAAYTANPELRILVLEPTPESYFYLRLALRANGIPVLSEEEFRAKTKGGILALQSALTADGRRMQLRHGKMLREMETETPKALLNRFQVKRLEMLNINCQGCELELIPHLEEVGLLDQDRLQIFTGQMHHKWCGDLLLCEADVRTALIMCRAAARSGSKVEGADEFVDQMRRGALDVLYQTSRGKGAQTCTVKPSMNMSLDQKTKFRAKCDRRLVLPVLVDKNLVKEIAANRSVPSVPTIYTGNCHEIPSVSTLPTSFAFKATHTHGCKMLIIDGNVSIHSHRRCVLDGGRSLKGQQVSDSMLRKQCKKWSSGLHPVKNEWAYSMLTPSILIEKLLRQRQSSAASADEIECYACQGQAVYLAQGVGRFGGGRSYTVYTRSGVPRLDLFDNGSSPLAEIGAMLEPEDIARVVVLCERMSAGLDFARVDFLRAGTKEFYLSGVSLYQLSGHRVLKSRLLEQELSQFWCLPESTPGWQCDEVTTTSSTTTANIKSLPKKPASKKRKPAHQQHRPRPTPRPKQDK